MLALAANDHHHRPVLGVFLKLSSVVLLSCLAACVKYLGDGVPTGQIIFVRGVISMAVLAFIAWRMEGLHVLRTDKPRSHAVRSLAGTASMFCWFTALTMIPLADFTAISFTAPMFLTLLAMLLLRRAHSRVPLDGARDRLRRRADHDRAASDARRQLAWRARGIGRGRVLGARHCDATQHERRRRRAPARDHVLLLADDGRVLRADGDRRLADADGASNGSSSS